MFIAQNRFIGAPLVFGRSSGFRSLEEVATLQREAATLATFKPATHRIFPVSCVQCFFPNVVPAGSRPPRRLLRAYPLERLPEIRSVPSFFRKSLIQQRQDCRPRVHAPPPTRTRGNPACTAVAESILEPVRDFP